MTLRCYEVTDFEWSVIAPLLPNKPRGVPWADIPERYGPSTTCYNRFVRWRKIGVWDWIFEAVSRAYDGDLQMVDSSSIRVHQHAANGKKGGRSKAPAPPLGTTLEPDAWGAR